MLGWSVIAGGWQTGAKIAAGWCGPTPGMRSGRDLRLAGVVLLAGRKVAGAGPRPPTTAEEDVAGHACGAEDGEAGRIGAPAARRGSSAAEGS